MVSPACLIFSSIILPYLLHLCKDSSFPHFVGKTHWPPGLERFLPQFPHGVCLAHVLHGVAVDLSLPAPRLNGAPEPL